MTFLDLFKIEYKKFNKSAVVRLLIILYVILTPLLIFAGKKIFPADVQNGLPFTVNMFYEYPTVWEYQGYISSWVTFIFLSFIAIHVFCSEVSNKTMRQTIINGMTRTQFFISKLISILFLSLLATVFYYITCVLIGYFHTPNPSFAKIWNNDMAGIRYFLSCMGHLSFAFLLAVLIRKSGIALFVYLAYVVMLEPGLRWLIYFKVWRTKAILYFPMNSTEDLFPMPAYKFAEAIPDDIDIDLLIPQGQAMVVTTIYILIFLGISYRMFLKRDI